MTLIPDFYHYDKIISWPDLQKNTHFVIFKGTQGTTLISPKLSEYIHHCERYEIPYWIYAYLNKGNELAQAKFLVTTCKNRVGKLFRGYCLDVEAGNTAEGVEKALKWLRGQVPKTMLYTSYKDYNLYSKVIANRGRDCAWWEARYGKNDGTYNPEKYPCHNGVDLYQYTSNGTCPGIVNKCDLSKLINMPETFFVDTEISIPQTGVTAEDVIKVAEGWLGLKESDGSFQVILDTYNDHKPLARSYKVKKTDKWCAPFISAVFIKAKAVDLIGGTECGVERMINDCFKPAGIWNEDGRTTPEPGWIITYNWNSKTQPNDGWADHIGLVVEVKDGVISVIEGNYKDAVGIRKIKVGDGRIRGYAMPPYATKAQTVVTPGTTKKGYTGKMPVLPSRGFFKRGDGISTLTDRDSRAQIERVQRMVNWINNGNIAVDGKYGSITQDAVKRAQKKLKVVVDGEFGPETLAAAKKYKR